MDEEGPTPAERIARLEMRCDALQRGLAEVRDRIEQVARDVRRPVTGDEAIQRAQMGLPPWANLTPDPNIVAKPGDAYHVGAVVPPPTKETKKRIVSFGDYVLWPFW